MSVFFIFESPSQWARQSCHPRQKATKESAAVAMLRLAKHAGLRAAPTRWRVCVCARRCRGGMSRRICRPGLASWACVVDGNLHLCGGKTLSEVGFRRLREQGWQPRDVAHTRRQQVRVSAEPCPPAGRACVKVARRVCEQSDCRRVKHSALGPDRTRRSRRRARCTRASCTVQEV